MASHSLKYFFEKQQKAAEQGSQTEHNISSQPCTPPIVDVEEAHSSLNDDPESEIIDDDEPVQKKAKRGFQLKWKQQMPWIKWDSKKDLVTCKVCTDAKIRTDNVQWTMGLNCPTKEGWKKYTFTQHEKSEGHKAALKVPACRNEFQSAHGAAMTKAVTPLPGKLMLMRNVLFAVKNELPISMVEKLHDLLMGHLSQLDDKWNEENDNSKEKSPFKIPGIDFHTSNYSTYEFLDALNKYVEEIELEELKKAKSFTVHVDESTDISKTKLLLVYTQHVDIASQTVKQQFQKVIGLQQTDAEALSQAILTYFQENGIDGRKMVMFTSDGANVMLGWQNGTAVKIKRALDCPHIIAFHCVAHLQALGVKDTCKMAKHASFMKMEHMLNDLIAFLNTHKHRVELNALADLLETEYTNLEPWIAVRWLSQSLSVQSVVRNLPVIMQYLENCSQDYPTAEGLFKRMAQIDFMVKLHAVNDVLYHLNTLNELYQREKMHPYDVKVFADSICEILDAFAATTETIKKSKSMKLLTLRLTTDDLSKKLKYHIKPRRIGNNQNYDEFVKIEEEKALKEVQDFTHDIIKTVSKRIDSNDSDLLKATKIFDPRAQNSQSEDDQESALEKLVEAYAPIFEIDPDPDTVKQEFLLLKVQCLTASKPNYAQDWHEVLWHTIHYKEAFPNLSILAEIILCFNASNANVERGFSLINRIKTKTRSRTTAEHVDLLMRLEKNGNSFKKFAYEDAFKVWAAQSRYKMGDLAKRRTSK